MMKPNPQKHNHPNLNGLYAITHNEHNSQLSLAQQVELAINGGARLIQYRDKSEDQQKRLSVAMQLKSVCKQHNIPFIVNDDIELAKQCQADGVHLGKHDHTIDEARKILGENSIIGVSCYNDLQTAIQAQQSHPNYVAFGSFFPSPTKPNAVNANIELLQQAKLELTLPICAIGGITAENAKTLIDAGADMLAVITDVFHQTDIKQAAKNIARLF